MHLLNLGLAWLLQVIQLLIHGFIVCNVAEVAMVRIQIPLDILVSRALHSTCYIGPGTDCTMYLTNGHKFAQYTN